MHSNSESIPNDLWSTLQDLLTSERRKRMAEVVAKRTQKIALVLQDVHQPHNISACLRSADAFGVQQCHIVTHHQPFKPSSVARGVENWLSIHHHSSIADAAHCLRDQGYQILAGMPGEASKPLSEVSPVDQPVAVVFGNEHAGVSDAWQPFLDATFTIPMVGFVESLNISVSAAITLQSLSQKVHELPGNTITASEQTQLLNRWVATQMPKWKTLYARLTQT